MILYLFYRLLEEKTEEIVAIKCEDLAFVKAMLILLPSLRGSVS